MIIDKLLLMSNAQAITATAASTDVIDLGVAEDLGVGDDPALKVVVVPLSTFTAGGAATMQVAIEGSPDNSSWTIMAETEPLSLAAINSAVTAGSQNPYLCSWDLPSLVANQALPRYIRMLYTVATGPMTGGTLSAFINLDRQQNRSYPAGINIAN